MRRPVARAIRTAHNPCVFLVETPNVDSSLLVLLNDIATVLDDVAVMSKVAAKKTSGVLADDLALNDWCCLCEARPIVMRPEFIAHHQYCRD